MKKKKIIKNFLSLENAFAELDRWKRERREHEALRKFFNGFDPKTKVGDLMKMKTK